MTNIEEKQIQLRKDTTTNLQDIVPIVAEPIYDTTKKKLAIGDGTTAFKDLPLLARDDEVEPSIALVNKTWGGRDLNTLLANESGNTIYNKLYNRAYAGNYKGLALGDYFDLALPAITITDGTTTYSIPAKTHRMRAIGYDVYRGCGWSIPNNNGANVAGHRITFMSDNTIGCNIPWQTVNNNNGTSDHKIAWLQSVVYACLNGVNNVSSNSFSGDTLGFDASSGGILQAFGGGALHIRDHYCGFAFQLPYLRQSVAVALYLVCGAVGSSLDFPNRAVAGGATRGTLPTLGDSQDGPAGVHCP